jgi:beta-lactam-binding protein with PASTA domain
VVKLSRVTEQIMFIAERWEAWHHVLGQGLAGANATQNDAMQAYFSHQLGSLEGCLHRLDDAAKSLKRAMRIRERIGDREGTELTQQNLLVLGFHQLSWWQRLRHRLGARLALTTTLSAIGLAVAVAALAGVLRTGPAPVKPTPTPSIASPSNSSSLSPSPSATSADRVTVPDVIGQTQAQAGTALESAGLTVTTTTTRNCEAAGDGEVVSQRPGGGSRVDQGTKVGLSVCRSGHVSPPPVIVPNVVGFTQQDATTTLQHAGLTATPTTTAHCTAANDGKVLSQNRPAGSTVPRGTAVPILVCSPPQVIVPDVLGDSASTAQQVLQGSGFNVSTSETGACGNYEPGDVTSQTPAGNSTALSGATVTIDVCPQPPPVP